MRTGKLWLELISLLLFSSPATAQYQTPPTIPLQDANGVDVRTGYFVYQNEDISVGQGEFPERLTLVRYQSTNPSLGYVGGFSAGTTHSLDFRVYRSTSGGVTSVYVMRGLQTDVFTQTAPNRYAGSNISGSTLAGDSSSGREYLNYTLRDGSVIKFQPTDFAKCSYTSVSFTVCGMAQMWTFPSGAQLKFTYGMHAVPGVFGQFVQSLAIVANNFGYQLAFATVFNSGQAAPAITSITATNGAYTNTGRIVGYTYTLPGPTLSTFTDTLGKVTTYTYTGNYALSGITPPLATSSVKTIVSGANGVTTSVTLSGAGTWNYSIGGVDSTITDPLGHVQTFHMNGQVVPAWVKDALARQTSFTYDSVNRITRITYPEGNYVQITYDPRGNVSGTTRVPKAGSGAPTITTSAAYPASCANIVTCNEPTSTTDERGKVTDYTYDSTHGGVLTLTSPAAVTGGTRPQGRYAYTALNAYVLNGGSYVATTPAIYRLTSVSECQTTASCSGGIDEVKTTVAYGTAGTANNLAPSAVSTGAGNGTLTATDTLTFDTAGNLRTVDGPLAGTADTAMFRYDSQRQLIGLVGPDPDGAGSLKYRALRYTYDASGRQTFAEAGTVNSQSDADWAAFATLQQRTSSYDSIDRLTTQTLTANGTAYSVIQYGYDADNRPLCVAVRMNPAIFGSLPSNVCSLGTQGSYGPDRITHATYDVADELTAIDSGYGTTDQATDVSLTYTNNRQVGSLTDAVNNKTSYTYDGQDRLIQVNFPSTTTGSGTSSPTDYEQYTYDNADDLLTLRNRAAQTTTFTYDDLGRVTLKDLPGAEPDVSYAYDLLNRVTGASQTGNALTYTYDALSRLLTEAGPEGTTSYQYDLANRRTRLTYPGTGLYVTYDYLLTGEVTAVRENGAATGAGVLGTYAYDDLGERTSLTRGNGTMASYSHDPVSRLTQLTEDLAGTANDLTLTFSYNPASQILSSTRSNTAYSFIKANENVPETANGLNQVTNSGGAAISFDANGNVSAIGASAYTYDSENMMLSGPGGVSLAYDPLRRLYQTTGTATTRFGYDGDEAVAEYDGSNALQRRFVYGPGTDEPLTWYEGSGTTTRQWFHSDERGSVIAVSDGTGNLVGSRNLYDEYGVPAGSLTGRFGYTGQMWVPELGLYNYKSRIYNPSLARLMQADPIGYASGMNLYAYAADDPINLSDPTGTQVTGSDIVVTGSHFERCRGCSCGRDNWSGFRFCACASTTALKYSIHAKPCSSPATV